MGGGRAHSEVFINFSSLQDGQLFNIEVGANLRLGAS